MSAIEGWNGHLIFPAEIVRGAERDPDATIAVLRKTRTRLYLQASVPCMQIRNAIFDLRRGCEMERAVLAKAAQS